MLLLSNANPLRWALRWGPPSAAYMIRLRGLGTHLFESAFVAVGLKYGSGKRRTRATLRFSRRARCPHRAVLGRPGVPPLRRESKPDSASGTGDREGRPYRQIGTFRSGRVRTPAPTATYAPEALVRETQAHGWNRTRSNFLPRQAPVGRNKSRRPLRFCAPEILLHLSGTRPPLWGF